MTVAKVYMIDHVKGNDPTWWVNIERQVPSGYDEEILKKISEIIPEYGGELVHGDSLSEIDVDTYMEVPEHLKGVIRISHDTYAIVKFTDRKLHTAFLLKYG